MADAISYSESHTEEEAMNYLYEKMIDFMIKMFDDLKDKVDYNDQEASFVVEKQDKGWIITEFVPNTDAEEEEE